jgi:hypothetical protein
LKLSAGPYASLYRHERKKRGDNISCMTWEGYDKKFSDFYSLSQIQQLPVSQKLKNLLDIFMTQTKIKLNF